jgi:hypothetical protein
MRVMSAPGQFGTNGGPYLIFSAYRKVVSATRSKHRPCRHLPEMALNEGMRGFR